MQLSMGKNSTKQSRTLVRKRSRKIYRLRHVRPWRRLTGRRKLLQRQASGSIYWSAVLAPTN